MLFMPRSHKTLCFLSASATCLLKRLFWLDTIWRTGHNVFSVLLAIKFLANSEFMNNFYFWLFGYLLFGLFSSSINWHQLHWSCQVWLCYPIVVFFSKLCAKIFRPLHFPLAAFVYITGFNTIRNVHLDDFSQESCKRTKMQRGKRTLELNCFYERNHIFWIGLSFLFISFLFALLTNQFHLPL